MFQLGTPGQEPGLGLPDEAVEDVPLHRRSSGGEVAGNNPTDRANLSRERAILTETDTDRKIKYHLAQFALAVTFLLTAKLIDWRDCWAPGCVPIR